MNKLIPFVFLSALFFVNSVYAYYGKNNAAEQYYSGKISTNEYLDSLGAPKMQSQETTVYHSDGSKSLIRSNSCGGTIYHSNGSKSVYYQSPN